MNTSRAVRSVRDRCLLIETAHRATGELRVADIVHILLTLKPSGVRSERLLYSAERTRLELCMEDNFSDLFGDVDDDLLFDFPGADFALGGPPSDQPQSVPDEALPALSVPVYATAAGDWHQSAQGDPPPPTSSPPAPASAAPDSRAKRKAAQNRCAGSASPVQMLQVLPRRCKTPAEPAVSHERCCSCQSAPSQ